MQSRERVHHGSKPRLRVAGPAPVDAAIANLGLKRRDIHAGCGGRVHVRFENHTAGRLPAENSRDQIRPAGKHLLLVTFDTPGAEELTDEGGDVGFRRSSFVSRVHAFDPDQVGEGVDHGGGHGLQGTISSNRTLRVYN